MVRIPTHREPTHPGEMLLEEFLAPMGQVLWHDARLMDESPAPALLGKGVWPPPE